MNSTNANLASWMQLGPAAAILCWMTLKHQFGDAEMRLLECMSITWMHNKQFSEAQLSLKKEHWWGSVTQFCTKTMFFTLGFLGAHAPKLLVQQLVRRTAGLCKWSLGPVQDLQCEKVNFIGQGCTQISSCFLCTIVEGTSLKTYAKYRGKKRKQKK